MFIYAAALAQSRENETVFLEGFETPRLPRTGRPSISELELAPGFVLTHNKVNFQATRLLDSLSNARKTSSAPKDLGFVGTSPKFFHNNYFQTYKYFSSNPRAQFWIRHALGLPQHSESRRAETAIHVRLGDYKNLHKDFGLLSATYYAAALDEIGVLDGAKVHVFSDDPEGAQALLRQALRRTHLVFREPSISPTSDMRELATFQNLVIANSSYSYWAGLAGDSNVFAPKKWFRSLRDPSDLHPPTWTLIESSWR